MATKLCIDWGNSLVKMAIFDQQDAITSRHTVEAADVLSALQDDILPKFKPDAAIICSVTNQHNDALSLLKDHVKHVLLLDSNTPLPIMNAYMSPETLGADRIAMAVAAHVQEPLKNNLVICAGTCVTYNFVGKNKTFRGGAIAPGLQMRLQAMHHFTDKLPEVSLDGDLLLLGYDTATCMRSGALFGMAAEMEGMANAYAAQYPDFNAILTGGDAPQFAGKLKSQIFADPELLLKGLNQIIKYNVPQLR